MSHRGEDASQVRAGPALALPAWVKLAGAVLGIVLLVAAVVAVISQREMLDGAWRALRNPSWPLVGLLVGAIVSNIVLSGLMFSALVSRYGRVGLLEMQAVIAVATLLNFLPIRPGMFGRVAYHRVVNGIRTVDAAKTVLQGAAISAGVALVLAAIALVCAKYDWPLWPAVGAGAIVLGMMIVATRFATRDAGPAIASKGLCEREGLAGRNQAGMNASSRTKWKTWRAWIAAVLCRYLDVVAWALRYWAAFALIGRPIGWEASVAMACVAIIATMMPLGANGLGLREWAIGLVAPFVSESTLESAIGADLLNRAVEIVVVLLGAGIGGFMLARLHGPGWHKSLRARTETVA
jgi:hypothetical protein